MDDATSAIYSAFLVEEEGTASTFRALNEVLGRHGLPLSLYTDRGSPYFHTPEAGGKADRTCLTQVGRALDHLGVAGDLPSPPSPFSCLPSGENGSEIGLAQQRDRYEHIAAYSPQARGHSERVFHTLQGRLTKELALAKITTVEAANDYLRDTYITAHNARFAIDGSGMAMLSSQSRASISWKFSAFKKSVRSATTIVYPSTV